MLHYSRIIEQTPSLLAHFLRDYRNRANMSRARVAARGHLSASLIEKWELEGKAPLPDKLAAWFSAVDIPDLYRYKIVSLFVQQYQLERSPYTGCAEADSDDLRHLRVLSHPACYLTTPIYDIVAANEQFYEIFPGLKQQLASPTGEPANLLVWQMCHPFARVSIQHWRKRTHVMLTRFRVLAPGSAPEERIDQIVAACSEVPEFTEMWESDPSEDSLTDPSLGIWGSDEKWHDYTTRIYHLEHPGRPFDLFTAVPVTSGNTVDNSG